MEITIPLQRGVYLLSDIVHKYDSAQRKHVCFRRFYVGESHDCAQRLLSHRMEGRLINPRMVLLAETMSRSIHGKINRRRLEQRFMAAAIRMGIPLTINGKDTLPTEHDSWELEAETGVLRDALGILSTPSDYDQKHLPAKHRCPAIQGAA